MILKLKTKLCVFLCSISIAVAEQKLCVDDSWVQSVDSKEGHGLCFKTVLFKHDPTSFDEGVGLCRKMGGFPSPFRGEHDRQAISESIERTNYKYTKDKFLGFYIGLRDVGYDEFRWVYDNKPVKYTSWSKGQPRSTGSGGYEQCVTVMVNDKLNWNDAPCPGNKLVLGFVCARKPELV